VGWLIQACAGTVENEQEKKEILVVDNYPNTLYHRDIIVSFSFVTFAAKSVTTEYTSGIIHMNNRCRHENKIVDT